MITSSGLKPVKPFLTYEQQIEHLITNKKLIINDEDSAMKSLSNISYYALIGGNKSLFYDPMSRTYLPGTTFEDIVNLYKFDESLRILVFEYSNVIEQRVRSAISYAFCEKYTNLQADYLNPNHYQNTRRNSYNIAKLLKILEHIANHDTTHQYIIYQRNTYGNVPLYAASKVLTFGQLSVLYSPIAQIVQLRVNQAFSTRYTSLSINDLIMYLQLLTHFRNKCAHIERLINYNDLHDIPDTPLHKKLDIPLRGRQYTQGKHDLFAVVIAYRYLLPKEDFCDFKRALVNLINNTVRKVATLTEAKLLDSMGFPKNWKDITRYRV